MTGMSRPGTTWRKSSRSGSNANCVEVAGLDGWAIGPTLIGVRDSKDPDGPALAFPVPAWSVFVTALRHRTLR